MIKKFLPNEYVKSVYDISPAELKARGIKGVITDLDNTLIEWDRPNATPQLIEWFKQIEETGMKVIVVSNNNENRVKIFSDPLRIPFIHRAKKPTVGSFKRALNMLELSHDQVVMVGDQVLTDIFGGNRLGLHTILVVPVAKTDGFVTKFNRMVERQLLKRMKAKGLLNWE